MVCYHSSLPYYDFLHLSFFISYGNPLEFQKILDPWEGLVVVYWLEKQNKIVSRVGDNLLISNKREYE